ncbi:MAG: SusC/RagA family TonB-linked outer membrane protein [Prevotellaceae bacterium]|jgi:TonB-linked SusC/RagA family outer membrane protein|nr:SusC/RagA family TonB-linked outer membrane protein [Prevotellaceae bacterium]
MYVKLLKTGWHKILLSVCALFFLSGTIWAQNIQVTGKVIDKTGEGIPGVYILVEGARSGTVTQNNGNYTISAPPNGKLVFSSLGYKTLTAEVVNRATINVTLEEDALVLEDVVIVAFGTQKRENISGAVASVDVAKTFESRPITDVGRALQGSTPGLSVTTTSGALGTTPTIRIRGLTGTLGGGDGVPLIMVDNVAVPDISYVNPDDIESISILKDAASTAVYGTRAAFGAVLITTKKGVKGSKVKVSYSNNFAWAKPTNLPEFTRADISMQYSLDQQNGLAASPATGFAPYQGYYLSTEIIAKTKEWIEKYGDGKGLGPEMVEGRDFDYNTGSNPIKFYRPWDVRSLFYKEWAPQQNHNISVNGGTESTQYSISIGMMNQGGVYQQFPDFYRRLSASGNISTDVNKYLSVRTSFMYTKTSAEDPMSFYSGTTDLQADIYGPTYYLYRWHTVNPYGTYQGMDFRNGVTEMKYAKPKEDDTFYSRYGLGATLSLNKNLYATFDYTYTQTFVTQHRTGGPLAAIDIFTAFPAGTTLDQMYRVYTGVQADYVSYDASRNLRNAYNGSIVYDNKFGSHAVKLQVGTNIEDAEYIYQRSKRLGLYDPDKGELPLAGGEMTVAGNHSWWSLVGLYGRLNYNYKEKYILEANLRYDWSSKFAKGSRMAVVPAFSAAWRVTEEPWMQSTKDILSSLKLRASYGTTANQDVPLTAYIPTIGITTPSIGNGFLINKNYHPAISAINTPLLTDPALTWEKVSTLDLAVDASFWKGKVYFTGEWYQRITSDMLTAGVELPKSVGAAAPRQNFGSLTTTGYELTLGFNHVFRNSLRVHISGQFYDYITKITKWAEQKNPLYSANYEGKVMGDIWGYKVDRLWQKDDFEYGPDGKILTVTLPGGKVTNVLKNYDAGYQQLWESGNFRFSPGDVKYLDLNGDGVINYGDNTLDNLGDRTVIGNTQPRYQYGFRIGAAWKGVDFEVFFQGVGKRHMWVTGNIVLPGYMSGEANFTHTLDYWTEDNPNAFYCRPINYAQTNQWNYQAANDRFLLNMAYLRCKNLNIGYSLPKSLLSKISVDKFRIYASGENLFEFDHLGRNPIDPELAHTNLTENDARAFGRAYPYRRSYSFGVQLTF